MDRGRKLQLFAFVVALTLYVAARIWGLTRSCLWFDEIFSVHAAEHTWDSIIKFVSLDLIHPPLFYVLLKIWIVAGGESLTWLRLFPVIFSIIAVFPFVSLCRELGLGRWTQTLAILLFAVNGSLIKYSQEVRMYSLLMCFSLFSIWLFARYFFKGQSFLPLVIVNVLMVYTHYFGWFVIVSEIALILWFQRIKWRRMAVMFGLVLVSFAPWAVALWQATGLGNGLEQNIGWMSRPGPREIATFVLNLIEPFYSQSSTAEPVSILRITLPLLLIVVTAAAIFISEFVTRETNDRHRVYFLLYFIVLPIIFVLIVSWLLPYSIWGTRHLLIVFTPFTVLIAVLVGNLPIAWFKAVAATMIILFSGYAFVLYASNDRPGKSWCSLESIVGELGTENGGIFCTFEDLAAYHIWFASRNSTGKPQIFKISNINGLREDRAYFLPRGFDGVMQVGIEEIDAPKIWIAYRAKEIKETEPPLRNFITKGYRITDRRSLTSDTETAIVLRLEK